MREVVKNPGFADHPALVEACFDDAGEISTRPFIELLEKEISPSDETLWPGQLLALQILQRRDKEAFAEISRRIKAHPSAKIRRWLKSRNVVAEKEIIIHEKTGIELMPIPGGIFMMGAPKGEEGSDNSERPQHQQQVGDLYIGRYPVTNEQYAKFLEANPEVMISVMVGRISEMYRIEMHSWFAAARSSTGGTSPGRRAAAGAALSTGSGTTVFG